MKDVKQAVQNAIDYYQTVMGDKISDIWLEEIKPVKAGNWQITLSGLAPTRKTSIPSPLNAYSEIAGIAGILNPTKAERLYKVFLVDSLTNEVQAMLLPTTND